MCNLVAMVHVARLVMAQGIRSLIACALFSLAASPAFAADGDGRRIRLGGISVSGGYMSGPSWWGPGYWGSGSWYGPSMWRPWGPAWFDPFWYGGWAHPGYWSGFMQGPGMGEVKLTAAPKTAMVYLDGAYAGPVSKLKSMWLEPGVYQIEVRDDGAAAYNQRIYVLSGKTLQLRAAVEPKTGETVR